MEIVYNILETIIPFDFIDYAFMKNALLAVLLISPIFAILGTMVVNNKMAFFSDALGHSALTGIAIGMLFGVANINISMIIFAVVFAVLLNYVKHKTAYGADTIISVFSSIAIALGLALLAQSGNFTKYSSYLVGDILSITTNEIFYLAIAFILTILFWKFFFNKLNTCLKIIINEKQENNKHIPKAIQIHPAMPFDKRDSSGLFSLTKTGISFPTCNFLYGISKLHPWLPVWYIFDFHSNLTSISKLT